MYMYIEYSMYHNFIPEFNYGNTLTVIFQSNCEWCAKKNNERDEMFK